MKIGCTRCGANLRYMPSLGKCHCDHCGSNIDLEEIVIPESGMQYDECTCHSCGAKLIVDETTAITVCAYCGSNQILRSKFQGEFNPTKILPFAFDNEEMQKIMQSFMKRKILAPSSFRNDSRFGEIKGAYVPFWVYSLESTMDSHGRAFREYYDNNGNIHFSHKYFTLSSTIGFESPQDASFKLNDSMMTSLEPFDLSKCEDFHPAYLLGFSADTGDETEEELHKKALMRGVNEQHYTMAQELKDYALEGGEVKIGFKLKEKYCVLLPVWFVSLAYRKGEYFYAINGQTKKIVGDVPVSIPKAIALGIALFGLYFVLMILHTFVFYELSFLLPFVIGYFAFKYLRKTYHHDSLISENYLPVDGTVNFREIRSYDYETKFGFYANRLNLSIQDEEGKECEELTALWRVTHWKKRLESKHRHRKS